VDPKLVLMDLDPEGTKTYTDKYAVIFLLPAGDDRQRAGVWMRRCWQPGVLQHAGCCCAEASAPPMIGSPRFCTALKQEKSGIGKKNLKFWRAGRCKGETLK
jgi:hypothetical protein